jgi:nitrilase
VKKACNIGIAQMRPAYLDKVRSLEIVCETVEAAGASGIDLLVFGESWLSGYPAWLDHCPEIALWDDPSTKEIFRQMYESSIDVNRDLDEVAAAVRQACLYLCIGLNEIVPGGPASGTIFNSALILDPEGNIALHHRKLMPTFTEKMVYGLGDGFGLRSVETPYGRLSVLICWEHWMPLSRQALHNGGEHIHVALWPQVVERHLLASRHYAFEGRCFVVTAGSILQVKDLPPKLKTKEETSDPDFYLLAGGASVIGPDAEFILEPQYQNEELITMRIEDTGKVVEERMTLDTSGHYQRPDIFRFNVNQERTL